jgi:hypothetical protein
MNTLSKSITQKFYKSDNGYEQLTKKWSEVMRDKELRKKFNSSYHLIYLILRGKNWQKSFTKTTNPIKLANGQRTQHGAYWALVYINYIYSPKTIEMMAFFGEFVKEEILNKITKIISSEAIINEPLDCPPYIDNVEELILP